MASGQNGSSLPGIFSPFSRVSQNSSRGRATQPRMAMMILKPLLVARSTISSVEAKSTDGGLPAALGWILSRMVS